MHKVWYASSIFIVGALAMLLVSSQSSSSVIATIAVGLHPTGIAITPDNRYVYVANYKANTITVITVANNTVTEIIHGFNEPYSITVNHAGTLVYVSNSGVGKGQNTVSVIDVATQTVAATIFGFFGPDSIAITPDDKTAYVANYGFPDTPSIGAAGCTVSVVDLVNNKIIKEIPVGDFVAKVAITPDGKYVYAANYNDGREEHSTISVIDTHSNTVIKTIPGFFGAYSIAMSHDCKFAYVTNFGSTDFTPVGTTISVIDIKTHTVIKKIPLGHQPSGVALAPHGEFLCATMYNNAQGIIGQGMVKIIDPIKNTVVGPSISVGAGPGAVAITPDCRHAYVTNYIANTVSVIALPTID